MPVVDGREQSLKAVGGYYKTSRAAQTLSLLGPKGKGDVSAVSVYLASGAITKLPSPVGQRGEYELNREFARSQRKKGWTAWLGPFIFRLPGTDSNRAPGRAYRPLSRA